MFTTYIFLISLVFLVLFSFIVLNTDRKSPNNQMFFSICMVFAIWMTFNYSVDVMNIQPLALLFSRLDFAFASIFGFYLLMFFMIFPEGKMISKKYIFLLLILPFAFFLLSIFTNLIISGIEQASAGYDITYGIMEIPYDIVLVGYILAGIILALSKIRRLDPLGRSQLIFVIVGIFFLTSFVLISNILLPQLFPEIPTINRVGYIGAIIWAALTSYAIVKKKLFDLKVILTETASGLVILAILSQVILVPSTTQKLISGVILLVVCYGAYLLTKSVQEEIKKKEQLQDLTTQLAQANSHLQELDAMKTEFVSLASHELLTPVSAIEGYLSMLLDEKLAKVEDPKALKFLDNVYKSAKRLARLVSDLLNISRIEEGRLLVEKSDTDLSDLVQQVLDELRFKAEEHKQKMVFETPGEWKTYGDPDKIKEVIVNLIGNSIKYSRDPGTISVSVVKVPTAQIQETWGKIEAEIKTRPLDDQESISSKVDPHLRDLVGDEQLLIKVKDQGIGIPKEELLRLFKKFHRVGNFSTQESQGTGLGLYISRALVELNHGRIWADSEGEGKGKGSIFTFSLPLLKDKQAILDLEAQAPKQEEQLKPLSHPSKVAEDI